MVNFKKNNFKIWHSPIILFILFIFVLILSYSVIGLFDKKRESESNKQIFLDKIKELNNKESSLLADLEIINTEEGIESIIRNKYAVNKEGEKMVTIVDSSKNIEHLSKEDDIKFNFFNWLVSIFKK